MGSRHAAGHRHRIDINNADQEDLELGVGLRRKQAAAVVEFRRSVGYLTSLDELEKVPGIDDASLRKLRAHAYIG